MEKPYTLRSDVNLMPWQIDSSDGDESPFIMVAVMNGNEMQSVSLHVAQHPHHAE